MFDIALYLATNIFHAVMFLISFLLIPAVLLFAALVAWAHTKPGVVGYALSCVAGSLALIFSTAYIGFVWPFGQPPGVSEYKSWVGFNWQRSTYSYDEYREVKKRNAPPTVIEIDKSVRRYKIIGWKPPMYARVSLQDVETGVKFTDYTVGKYCASKTQVLGAEVNLDVREYRMSNDPPQTIRTDFLNLRDAFCS